MVFFLMVQKCSMMIDTAATDMITMISPVHSAPCRRICRKDCRVPEPSPSAASRNAAHEKKIITAVITAVVVRRTGRSFQLLARSVPRVFLCHVFVDAVVLVGNLAENSFTLSHGVIH